MPCIVLTGGGTAGHITPNLALVPELYKYFDKVAYVAGNGMEKTLVPSYGLPFYETETVKLNRSHILENFKIPFALSRGIREAKSLLTAIGANVVFSKGGYASLPTVFAANALKLPIIIHESDYSLGVANTLCAHYASRVLTSFPETEGGEFVGNPIRKEIFEGNAERALEKLNLPKRKTLLVFGGSSGAESINSLVFSVLPMLTEEYNVIHVTGESNLDKAPTRGGYRAIGYCDYIADLYALADVILMRGGANSLAEVTALGKRAVVIPLPKGGSRGDQVDNARSYAKRGLVTMLEQHVACEETLLGALKYASLQAERPTEKSTVNVKIVKIILQEYSAAF